MANENKQKNGKIKVGEAFSRNKGEKYEKVNCTVFKPCFIFHDIGICRMPVDYKA